MRSPRSKVLLSWALAMLVSLVAGGAHAEDARARARTLFNEGVAQYEAGHFRDALSAFEQAYRVAPHPTVRVNMANCFEQLGQPVEALFNFRRFLEESGDDLDPATRDEIEVAIARLSARVGTVVLDVDPSAAKLTIDGKEPKRAPNGGVQLPAGTHTLRATAPGYEAMERAIEVEGGSEQRVSMLLSRETPEAAPAVAQAVDESEPEPAEAPVDEVPQVDEGERSLRKPLMWAAASTTAAFATSFAVTGGLALQAQNQFERAVTRSNDATLDPSTRAQARADGLTAADRADLRAMLSDVFLAGTIVGVGATVLIYLTTKKPGERRATSFNAGPMMLKRGGGAGVAVGGKF